MYDFLSHAQLQIYIIRTKLRNIRSSFFQGMLKSSSAGGCLGVPLRVGLSAASPRYAVGFPLQSLTWMKGLSLSCTCTLASVSDHFGRLHGRSRTSGRKDKRNTSVRAVTRGFGCLPKLPVPPPARKSSPVFVRQPEPDRAPIYFSRPYLLALGNGRSRLSGRLLFPAPGK